MSRARQHEDLERLVAADHDAPHEFLGVQLGSSEGHSGAWVRYYAPGVSGGECEFPDGFRLDLEASKDASGLLSGFRRGWSRRQPTRLRVLDLGGDRRERRNPYDFSPTIDEAALRLFARGRHPRLWEMLGARVLRHEGVEGVGFAVWAPNARSVSVVGDFCGWDGRAYPMRRLGDSGVFELFVPGLAAGAIYKYQVRGQDGELRLKADPMARAAELPPATASRVADSAYAWGDDDWIQARGLGNPTHGPMSIYEVHVGSWWKPDSSQPNFRVIADRLVAHVERYAFTHVELMPVAEHPYLPSWGYQVGAYYAPTARWGTPDDLRYLIDRCHQRGIGVLMDWVPAHFPKDSAGLCSFDGSPLYEHADPRIAESPEWGTLQFNHGRREVCNFLVSNALYWIEEFHVDGIRVDAVTSMLYRDWCRDEGGWVPHPLGGREDLDAADFLKRVNREVHRRHPGVVTCAEESTAWTGVTESVTRGGLGFDFKWNMGWMHDTLRYFGKDPIHRSFHHEDLTFPVMYDRDERFILPLSHDEVVHGKRSLIGKLPGDDWQRFATLRLLLMYQYTRPGKKLCFMGTEFAPESEWNHDVGIDWSLAEEPRRAGFSAFLEALGSLYRDTPAFWLGDHRQDGFQWLTCDDRERSVVAYRRAGGTEERVIVLNCTPVPRERYRIGVPRGGLYRLELSSDERRFGGSELPSESFAAALPIPCDGFPCSIEIDLPPLAGVVWAPESGSASR